jgi:uncharacterized YigZ family protein
MIKYRSIRKEAIIEQIIERSRFIAHAKPVETKAEALEFFDKVRARQKAATHNVPAYVIGEKSQLQWASDDGEPQGSSGAPIVHMLLKEEITNTAIIVTRYFGGIKLGIGGLVRAYTGTAKQAIEAAGICNVQEMNTMSIKLDYNYLARLQSLADGSIFSIGNIVYEDKITVDIIMEPERAEEAVSILSDLTGGCFTETGLRQELIKI